MTKKKVYNVGILGLGRAGYGMHANELKGKTDKFKIAAGCDPFKDYRDKVAAEFKCPVYESYAELLADKNVDLISVATRSVDHFAHAKLALEAGKHVALDKPICINHAEAVALKKIAAKAKGKLFIRHNRRFDPDFLRVQEILAEGLIGEVFEIKLTRWGYQRRNDWQVLKSAGGGQLLNWGPHIIDHALRFLDSPVKSMWSDLKKIAAAGDAEDQLKIVLRGANGRVADIEISGGAAASMPHLVVLGSKGCITVQGNEIKTRYLNPEVKLAPLEVNNGPGGAFGNAETLYWVEKSCPAVPNTPIDIWDEVYNDLTGKSEYPITVDSVVEVMRVISEAKKGTQFE